MNKISVWKIILDGVVLYIAALLLWGPTKVHFLLFDCNAWRLYAAIIALFFVLSLNIENKHLSHTIKLICFIPFVYALVTYWAGWSDGFLGISLPEKFFERNKAEWYTFVGILLVTELLLRPFTYEEEEGKDTKE